MSLHAPLAATADTWIALVIVGLAAAFLVRRATRVFAARKAGGCACPGASACGSGGPGTDDLANAAKRAVQRIGAPPR